MANDKRKQSLYFPEDMLAEIQGEASRLDRSLSWVVQYAWKVARGEFTKLPSAGEPAPAVAPERDAKPPVDVE